MRVKIYAIAFSLFASVSFLNVSNSIAANNNLFVGQKVNSSGNYVTQSIMKSLDARFRHYDVYSLDMAAISQTVKNGGEQFNLRLQLGSQYDWNLTLEPSKLLADDLDRKSVV